VNDEEAEGILAAATQGSLDPTRVRREYQFLKIYVLETALQNVDKYAEEAVAAYRLALAQTTSGPQTDGDFMTAYACRMASYDEAWQDARGAGWGVSMANAFAEFCTDGDPIEIFQDVLPLWVRASAQMVEFTKWAKSLRLVSN
jgi:hypothetical protein